MNNEILFEQLSEQFAEKSWAVVPKFISPPLAQALLADLQGLQENGKFKKAGIGQGQAHQIRSEIRSDYVHWWEEQTLSEAQQQYWQCIEALRQSLNRSCYLGLQSFECHYAAYPPAGFYKKHLDQFQHTKSRIVSCILYLNEAWQAADGGALRVYHEAETDTDFTDILPQSGTLVCLHSPSVWHEVRPTERPRFSITGWLRNELLW